MWGVRSALHGGQPRRGGRGAEGPASEIQAVKEVKRLHRVETTVAPPARMKDMAESETDSGQHLAIVLRCLRMNRQRCRSGPAARFTIAASNDDGAVDVGVATAAHARLAVRLMDACATASICACAWLFRCQDDPDQKHKLD